jgi:hypothetical protein
LNPRNTALLFLVVAAVGAFVWFYEIEGADERKQAEEAAKHVFQDLKAEDVSALVVRTTDGATARLERKDRAWRLTEPVDFPADAASADAIASALAQLGSEAEFEKPEAPAEYGLAVEPTVRFEAGGQSHVLRLGAKSPVGANTYVATEADAPVWAVATYRVSALQKSLEQLRDKRVLDFDREAVEGIRAAWPGGGVRLTKREGEWHLLEPLGTRADGRAVENLLSDLYFLRTTGFLDDPPPDEKVGLDRPEFQVDLLGKVPEGGGEAPRLAELRIGATVDGEYRAVRGSQPKTLFRIPVARLDDFPRKVVAWRFKELARFVSTDAQRLELVFHDEGSAQTHVVEGELGDAGWTTKPENMAAGKASRLVAELADLDGADVAAEKADEKQLAELGLAPPRALLRVLGEAAEGQEPALLAEVQLGRLDPKQGIAARRAGAETVYWLDPQLAEHLPVGLDAFRNRFVSAEPPPEGAAPAEEKATAEPVPEAEGAPAEPPGDDTP